MGVFSANGITIFVRAMDHAGSIRFYSSYTKLHLNLADRELLAVFFTTCTCTYMYMPNTFTCRGYKALLNCV